MATKAIIAPNSAPSKLDQIMAEGRKLATLLEIETEENGELSDSTISMLKLWEQQLTEKADGIIYASRRLSSDADHYKEEADRLLILAIRAKRSAQFLEDRIHQAMRALGIDKINGHYKITVQRNGGATPVEVEIPAEDLPEGLRKSKTVVTADLDGIRQLLENGGHVRGCRLRERGTHLRVR